MTRTIKTITQADDILFEFHELDQLGHGSYSLPHGEVWFSRKYIENNWQYYLNTIGTLSAAWLTGRAIDYMNTLIAAPMRASAITQGSFTTDK